MDRTLEAHQTRRIVLNLPWINFSSRNQYRSNSIWPVMPSWCGKYGLLPMAKAGEIRRQRPVASLSKLAREQVLMPEPVYWFEWFWSEFLLAGGWLRAC